MRTCLIAVAGTLLGASTLLAADSPTFYKDVLPILQANCQSCHRAGEVAPMSLITFVVKTNFPEDMWVTAAEMRAGNPKVLHHGKVWVRPPGSTRMQKAVPGEAYERETASHREIMGNNAIEEGNDIIGKFNPGLGAQRFDMEGAAKFVPTGSDLVYELHYTTAGEPMTDVSRLGLVLAKEPQQQRYFFHAGPLIGNRFY